MTHRTLRAYLIAPCYLLLLAVAGCRGAPPPSAAPPSAPPPASPAAASASLIVLPGRGHGGTWAVAFSPDGRLLAVEYDDGTVGVWSLDDKRLRWALKGHSQSVTDVACSPDGRTLVGGSEDGSTIVWDLATGKRRTPVRGRRESGGASALSPDGKTLATGGADNIVRLWNTRTWRLKRRLRGDAGPEGREYPPSVLSITEIAFSPDGKWLAVAHRVVYPGEPMQSADYISLRNAHTGKVNHSLCYLDVVHDHLASLAFSPDSAVLIAGHYRGDAGGHLERWDVASGERTTLAAELEPGASEIAFALGGQAIVVVGGGEASLWHAKTGERIARIELSGSTSALSVAPDGALAAIGDDRGNVTLWRLPQENR